MREQTERIAVSLDVINPSTGEYIPITGTKQTTYRYYSIKKLNFKGNIMDLFSYQAKICKSSKDIELFRDILFHTDKNNELRVNISEFAEEYASSRQRVTKFLADSVKVGFMKKVSRGVYLIDPFAFKSKGSTNEIIEKLQQEWNDE